MDIAFRNLRDWSLEIRFSHPELMPTSGKQTAALGRLVGVEFADQRILNHLASSGGTQKTGQNPKFLQVDLNWPPRFWGQNHFSKPAPEAFDRLAAASFGVLLI